MKRNIPCFIRRHRLLQRLRVQIEVSLLLRLHSRGLLGGGFDAATPTSTVGKVVFISNQDVGKLCLGKIGTQSRFCIAPKVDGENHCGVGAHGKFKIEGIKGNHYYPPGGINRGKPTARIEPTVARDKIPESMMGKFLSSEERSDWAHVIIDAAVPEPEPFNIDPGANSVDGGASRISTSEYVDYHTPGSKASVDINEGGEENGTDNWSAISSLHEEEFDAEFNINHFNIEGEVIPKSEGDDKSWVPITSNHDEKLSQLGHGLSRVGKHIPKLVRKLDSAYKPAISTLHDMLRKMQSDSTSLEDAIYRTEQAQANVQATLGDLSDVLRIMDHWEMRLVSSSTV